MTEIKVTNMVKFYAILLLFEKPRHGYELMHSIGEKLEAKISPGQMYPFLKKLQRNRLISVKTAAAREKKVYALTKDGRAFARRLLERFGSIIDLAVEPKLTVCTHCGCKTYGKGYEEKINGKKLQFCCSHCADSFKKEKHGKRA